MYLARVPGVSDTPRLELIVPSIMQSTSELHFLFSIKHVRIIIVIFAIISNYYCAIITRNDNSYRT